MSISLQGTSREGRLRIAKWVLVLLLVAAAFLHHAQPAQAQTIVYIQGEWSGSTTQSSPPPPLGPTWQISGMLYQSPGTSGVAGWLDYTQGSYNGHFNFTGTISGSTLTYDTTVESYNLPFGIHWCNATGATATVTPTSITGTSGGGGGCSGSTVTFQLNGNSGTSLGTQPPTCQVGCACETFTDSTGAPQPPNNGDGCWFVGAPINVATGNMFEHVTDYQTAGPNVLSFTRYYNSMPPISTFASALGTNWRHSFDRYLNFGVPSQITAERPDGRQMIFTPGGLPKDPSYDMTLGVVGSNYVLTDHDDNVETYSISGAQGILQSIATRNGYTLTMGYTGGLLTSVTDSYGRTLTLTYSSGLLLTVTTPDGLTLTYGYNASGVHGSTNDRLASVSYSTSPVTSLGYGYTNSTFPFALTGITDENGASYASWTYDGYGRALTSQLGSGADLTSVSYNDTAITRTVTSSLGQTYVYAFLNLAFTPRITQVARSFSGSSQYLNFTFDSNNYISVQTDWLGNETVYTSDTHGDPTSIIEAYGTAIARTTTLTYDPTWQRLPDTVTTDGVTTSFTYDTNGNVLTRTDTDTTGQTVPYPTNGQTRTWTYSWSNHLPATVKTPNGNTTTFTFDATGALTAIADPLTHTTNITSHTGGGWPLTVVDPNSVTTTLTYSPRMWPMAKTVSTTAGPMTTTNAYDAAGNLTQLTRPDGSYVIASYDTAHRLTTVTDSFGNNANYTLDANGDATALAIKNPSAATAYSSSATFDKLGRVLTDVIGTGASTAYTYNVNGNIMTYNPPGVAYTHTFDELNRTKTEEVSPFGTASWTYDAHDRALTASDRNSNATSYVYDGFGDVIQEMSPDRGTTVYTYDADANLTKQVDALGVIANYTYDALDRLATVVYPADTAENVTYTYDQTGTGFAFGIGRLTTMADLAGSLVRTYDERGDILTEKRSPSGGGTSTTSYGYDAAQRIAAITYPDGALVSYTRNAMGQITGVSGTPSGGSPTTLASSVTYEPLGPWAGLTFGNGISETPTWDADYRITHLVDGTVQNISYSYNNDMPSVYTDNLNSANTINPIDYDAAARINVFQTPAGRPTISYDDNNNRTGYGSYTYSMTAHSNKLAAFNNGTAYTITNNANGNVTGISPAWGAAGVTALSYNNANQLSLVSGSSGALGTYLYDGFGNRYSKLAGSTTTTFTYAPDGTLLAENNGTSETDYIYINDRPLAMFNSSGTGTYTWLQDDRMGRPQVATNSSGTAVWKASYYPWGETLATSGSFVVNLRFPGQYYDVESGFDHNGFRDYWPQGGGRYLEFDPIGLEGGLNPYVYVYGNPTSMTDPSGLYTVKPNIPPAKGALADLLACTESCMGSTFTVTSTSEQIKQHPRKSPHGKGLAADIRYPTMPKKMLCCLANCRSGFALDERRHPSQHASGPHIHTQIPPGKKGGHGDLPFVRECHKCE